MAHFIGGVHGNRGPASRLGTKASGIAAYAQGWDIGADVHVYYNEALGEDVVTVEINRGSNGGGFKLSLGSYVLRNGNLVKLTVELVERIIEERKVANG